MMVTSDSDENVTELIIKPHVQYKDPPRYMSKFRKFAQETFNNGKSPHKTFGLARVPLNPPSKFLRKKSRIEVKHNVKHEHYRIPDYQHKLPAWEPQKDLNNSENINKSEKNFKNENISKIKNSHAKKPQLYYADDRYGNSFPRKPNRFFRSNDLKGREKTPLLNTLDPSMNTLEECQYQNKKFVMKKDKDSFGRKEKMSSSVESPEEKQSIKTELNKKRDMCRHVSAEERAELLNGMKKRWNELMKQFQGLPLLTDTVPKIKKKSMLEQKLKQLEKDIDMIQRYEDIYVYNDDKDG